MQNYKIESYGQVNGYITVCVPTYPRPSSVGDNGWQYEHIFLKELELGRFLNSDECVHHLDGNKTNNLLSNLIVLSYADHIRIHKWIDAGKAYSNTSEKVYRCVACNTIVKTKQNKYCSIECMARITSYNRRVTIDNSLPNKLIMNKETLIDLLTKHKNFSTVGKLFGVSDNAIRKWCKKFNISASTSYWRSLNKPIYTPPKLHRLTSDEITQVKEYFSLPKTDRPYSVRELAKMLDVHHTTLYDIGTKLISPTPTNIT